MENLGFIYGIIGMTMGITAMVFAIIAMSKADNLEKKLKSRNLLD